VNWCIIEDWPNCDEADRPGQPSPTQTGRQPQWLLTVDWPRSDGPDIDPGPVTDDPGNDPMTQPLLNDPMTQPNPVDPDPLLLVIGQLDRPDPDGQWPAQWRWNYWWRNIDSIEYSVMVIDPAQLTEPELDPLLWPETPDPVVTRLLDSIGCWTLLCCVLND